jgi:enamine deaminase RidA (YjgF/YER057c/UK114 family)
MTGDTAARIARINPPELGTPPGYSQAVEVRAGGIIFIAGQTALDQGPFLSGFCAVGPEEVKIRLISI